LLKPPGPPGPSAEADDAAGFLLWHHGTDRLREYSAMCHGRETTCGELDQPESHIQYAMVALKAGMFHALAKTPSSSTYFERDLTAANGETLAVYEKCIE